MRIAYWSTSSLEPGYEAVSSEVFDLARAFPGSWLFGVSPHFRVRFSARQRYAGFHTGFDPGIRVLTAILQHAFDVNHVYGDLAPWTFQKSLKRQPIVHTVTRLSEHPAERFLERCRHVVVQTPEARRVLEERGVPPDRLHLWFPGIDLGRFRPRERRTGVNGPSILFAAAPRSREELETRGVRLLVETARRQPDFRFRFLYRTWQSGYTSHEATRRLLHEASVTNVELTDGVAVMPEVYPGYDFTVIPFLDRSGGKECPNSALESLACGIPVLVSSACPFSEFVEEHRCGVTFDPRPESLASAVERGLSTWEDLSARARAVAEASFDREALFARYRTLYEGLGRA